MIKGDHLVTERIGYTHHGLYIGDNEVIHYAGFSEDMDKGKIEITSYEDFSQNKNTYIKTHFNRVYNEIESVTRAYSRLGEDEYNLVFNNCEHFVSWCIDGLARSEQVEIFLKTFYDYIEEYWEDNKDLVFQQILKEQILKENKELLRIKRDRLKILKEQILKENIKRDVVTSSLDKTVLKNSVGTVYGVKKVIDWFRN